jgi:osmotically inducible protein OsmC
VAGQLAVDICLNVVFNSRKNYTTMPTRKASANWNGDLKSGKGEMEFGSGAWKGAYSFSSRMEDGTGTNPEELIAAAHAGCFSMALTGDLGRAGFAPTSVNTKANLQFSNTSGKWAIDSIELNVEASAAGIDEAKLKEIAAGTKDNCPVSRALTGVAKITVNAKLV